MKTKFLALLCASAACLAAVPAQAATVYSNGPINGTISGWTINNGYAVSNSFTLSSAATITGFTFGGWSYPTDTFLSVDYGFSTSPDYAVTGTAAVAGGATIPGTGFGFYEVRDYSASIAPVTLAAGTYWFALQNAVTAQNNYAYWDVNNGPSAAYENAYGDVNGYFGGSSSSAFTLTTGSVPEPASWAMMVGGFGLIGGAMRARRTNVSFA
ncbi:MAG TPA: PEPxxWA-CTERM sorting domain-containing protein [Sphingomonas sp.]|nr:PEPxxWA-CTERM sorting domain-containing protein [Sphingomonas sp.]